MQTAWVETEDYIGPCRRAAQGFRIVNKRRQDRALSEPSLNTLVRQLRVINLAFANIAELQAYRLRLKAAHDAAIRKGDAASAHLLGEVKDALEQPYNPSVAAFAASRLDQVAANLG